MFRFFLPRLPLYCVPVPGLSAWAIPPDQGRQEEREGKPGVIAPAATGGGLPKRQREDATEGAGGEGEDAMDCTVSANRSQQITMRRTFEIGFPLISALNS